MTLLTDLDLKGAQQAAAEQLDTHLAVTAGAGAGKTRTLVARYLHWVEAGTPVRALIAITFTEKAAREMRARIRTEIEKRLVAGGAAAGLWQTAYIELDSAPIGTIHGLCADLLRLYPAEARVDPRFGVIEDGRGAMLRAQAIEAALAWAVSGADAGAAALFADFKEAELRHMLRLLVSQRLEAVPALRRPNPLADWEAALRQWLEAALSRPAWLSALDTLTGLASLNSEDRMEAARVAVLAHWQAVQQARAAGDWDGLLAAAASLRAATTSYGQQKNWPQDTLAIMREAMKRLREEYSDGPGALMPRDGASWALDQAAAERWPALARLCERALAEYEALKEAALGLDFDDLEGKAAELLGAGLGPGPADRPRALLVDEFQDTNARQRQIVYALAGLAPRAGQAANLFIVGDAKQSIYGFRGADVTVFRGIQADLTHWGGQHLDLSLTFRAHAPLLAVSARLLRPLMGEVEDPARPYAVPFAPLSAHRAEPRAGVAAPFIEFQIGLGDATDGRRAAAAALAIRLRELSASEGFEWEQMALLFRASSAFPVYEDALEAAGIPYVTVAGEGFYDRPEIRDLLNALTALADPSDDLALAGLLRSPAFGLRDADLYRLRYPQGGDTPSPLYPALRADQQFAVAAHTLAHLNALSGRLPIAELLKDFIDRTHYRAILKAGGGQRLSRNVDKLLADAHRSRLVAVGDFLDYVRTLRDIGAREGEAPAEVGGAVQLMTIHKAKGLEFPLVVLADAAHSGGGRGGESLALDPALGLLLKLTADKVQPLVWQLGRLARADREAAEDRRLLYVALTRAQEKIIINGHAKIAAAKDGPARLALTGWLGDLGEVIGLDSAPLAEEAAGDQPLTLLPGWDELTATLHPLRAAPARPAAPAVALQPSGEPGPLVAPLAPAGLPADLTTTADTQRRVWRVISGGRAAPAWVVGRLVHEALRLWLLPPAQEAMASEAEAFEARLRPLAWALGLTEPATVQTALRETRRLLERLRAHPLAAEIESAAERQHAVPCQLGDTAGTIDLLYRLPGGWVLADFRTDELRTDAALEKVLPGYRQTLGRYAGAVLGQLQLAAPPRALLVFLNLKGAVSVIPLRPT